MQALQYQQLGKNGLCRIIVISGGGSLFKFS
jgi:hypothetical protein